LLAVYRVRVVGSTRVSTRCSARHTVARNQPVLEMLERIQADGSNADAFVTKVKNIPTGCV
jgi:hypothetical protein